MKNINRVEIFKRAWEIIRSGADKSTAFKTAWAEAKLFEENARKLFEANERLKEMQATVDELKQNLIDCMDGAEEVKAGMFTVKNITVMRNILDTAKFKAENKEIYESYLKSNESKRFTITSA